MKVNVFKTPAAVKIAGKEKDKTAPGSNKKQKSVQETKEIGREQDGGKA